MRTKATLMVWLIALAVSAPVVLLTSPYRADEEAAVAVPASWKRVARSQGGRIESPVVRGGYLAWRETRPDAETAHHVVALRWEAIYRLKLDGNERVELVRAPRRVKPSTELLLGDGGLLLWSDSGIFTGSGPEAVKLSTPAKAPINYPYLQPGGVIDLPLDVAADGFVCRSSHVMEGGLAFVPARDGVPDVAGRFIVADIGPFEAARKGDVYRHGSMLLYRLRPAARERGAPPDPTVLYGLTARREVRRYAGEPCGLDGDFVYIKEYAGDGRVAVVRHPLAAGAADAKATDRIVMPRDTLQRFEFNPPFVGVGWVDGLYDDPTLLRADTSTGTVWAYDVPRGVLPSRWRPPVPRLYAVDLNDGTAIATDGHDIYAISSHVVGAQPWAKW